MTNELVKVELTNSTGFPRRYIVADGTAIDKGTLLKLSDPRTAAASDGEGDYCAGVASMDKEANDGSTSISAWTDGIFEAKASGAITAGQPIISAGEVNEVKALVITASEAVVGDFGAKVIGYALESADDAETINVRIRL